MRLDEFAPPKGPVISTLPPEVLEQLIYARVNGTHSVPQMVAWLKSEGHGDFKVSTLRSWFNHRGYSSPNYDPDISEVEDAIEERTSRTTAPDEFEVEVVSGGD